jgi:hypothetical protein
VASWLFFSVARSLRIHSDMLVASASAARTALKNSQLTDGESMLFIENENGEHP